MYQKWTGKSLGNGFLQFLLRGVVKYGGRHIAYFISYFVVAVYTFIPSIRKKASFYLKRRFESASAVELFFHTYKLNFTLAKILIDRAVFGIKGKISIISSRQNQQLCRDLIAQGKGLIIITAHCGCWQMAMSAFDFMEGDKYVVYRRNKEDVDKHVHELSGKKATVNFIDPAGFGGGGIEIMAALSKKSIICMMGDRTFGSEDNKIEVGFLGGKIDVPYTVYRIAGAMGTPVAIIFFPYENAGRVDSIIADTFFVEEKGPNSQNYLNEAQKFIKSLENFCKLYPYQFFNYYDAWKQNKSEEK
ncbi:MAG: lysophospholipid acyltransferase family protein [Endomicrobium sp.]|jgi:predicted LPLAT superfamily acyltransferase|nr:lysophospholipid acyltransferase family protein [Endomicrobium sp.]